MRLLVVVVCLLGGGAGGAKILALFPFPFYSHTHAFIPVFRELSARGHHLTFLSPYPQIPSPHNWTNIITDRHPMDQMIDLSIKYSLSVNKYGFFFYLYKLCTPFMEIALRDKAFEDILSSESLDYDLIITETFYCHESLAALGTKHGIPVVSVFPITISSWASYFTGNSFLPSYIPNYRTTFTDQMSFLQRVDNTLLTIFQLITGLYYYLPKQELLVDRYIYKNSKDHPSLFASLKNVSLNLIDTHHSLAYSRPYQAHTIPVGGLSTTNHDALPKDLQDFMDNSLEGVIYLNFGTFVPVSSLSVNALDAIMTTFEKINLKVLMKWEKDVLDNKPPNVKIAKWFPQLAIFAHPKCRLFVNHGGLHGMHEALYHGVPIIGIPFISDQQFNMQFAVKAGFGYQIYKEDLTTENFKQAIETVLNDKLYKENAMKRSQVIRSTPNSMLETAVYWIEYALHHRDLSHLRPASADLPIYKLFLLDVFSFLFLSLLIFTLALYYLIKKSLNLLIRNKPWHITFRKKNI